MHRWFRFAPALAAIALVACGSSGKGAPDAGQTACGTLADCTGNGGKQVCLSSVCVNTCSSNTGCQTAATPDFVCEEAVCLPLACGNDNQCGAGQSCLGGACKTASSGSQVASCEVTPNPGDVRVGSTLQLKVIALDAEGKPLHLASGITWSVASYATIDASGALTGTAFGDAIVTAAAGAKTCTATVHVYAPPAPGTMRVTVIHMHTKEPVNGAKVLIDAAALTTNPQGVASATLAAGPHDVHVFAVGYHYTSFVQTSSTDLLVPVAPYLPVAQRSGFASHLCDSKSDDPNTSDPTKPQCPSPEGEFAPLPDQGEVVHMAFFGSSVPNSLLDLSVDTLVGPMHSVTIALPGTTTSRSLSLPYGLVLGIGPKFFGTNDPRVYAEGGVRALWGIGGNINLSKIITILSPLLQPNATTDIATLLPQLLGFFGRLEAGAVVGVQAPANAFTPTFKNQPIQLTTPMRLRVDATSPKLPTLDGKYLDGVLAVAGALDYPMGFLPLGLTAGLSARDNAGGVLDPTCDTAGPVSCDTNLLPVKFAPENGGTEGSPVAISLLAVNFTHVAVSGQVTLIPNDQLKYVAPGGTYPKVAPPDFMKLPASNSIVVTRSTRNVSITGDGDGNVQIYRFELENAARQNWNLWAPPAGSATAVRNFHLPNPGFYTGTGPCDPMAALCDPFADAQAQDGTTKGPTARLLALELTSSTATADQLETFSGALHLDELGPSLKAFTALQVNVSP